LILIYSAEYLSPLHVRVAVLSTVTCYWLDSGLVGEKFFGLMQTGPKIHQASCAMGTVSLPLG